MDHPRNPRTAPRHVTPLGLALPGGGSWGAYAWGVLDALLACPDLPITQLSGTSAGAINAAIVASALAQGSREQARSALASFWHGIADPASADVLRALMGPLGRLWRSSLNDWLLSNAALQHPVAHALGANPLRTIVAEHVDIEAIRSGDAPALFVTLTSVRTGLPRVVSNEEMSIDALLASACLPHLFAPVEIAGEAYWDGGYSGNPSLWPLLESGLSADLLLVQLTPDRVEQLPLDGPAIRRRVGEIVFHASLASELRAVHRLRDAGVRGPIARTRLHRVEPPGAALQREGDGGDRGRAWLGRLHDEGLAAGRRFLARHRADLGLRETLDIARAFGAVAPAGAPAIA